MFDNSLLVIQNGSNGAHSDFVLRPFTMNSEFPVGMFDKFDEGEFIIHYSLLIHYLV